MKYFIRHKYGMSKEFNTFEFKPWHGAGQGAADATLRYIVLSDMLIDVYHRKIQPWTILDPTLTLPILKSLKAFIDNVVMSAGGTGEMLPDLINKTQSQVEWWNALIQASGGSLNPSKCCCMVHSWSPDKLGILRPANPLWIQYKSQLHLTPPHPRYRFYNHAKGCATLAYILTNCEQCSQWRNTYGRKHYSTQKLFNERTCHDGKLACSIGHVLFQLFPTLYWLYGYHWPFSNEFTDYLPQSS